MSFSKLQQNWEELGKQDPLWAILTESDRRGGKWSVEEFFRWGAEEVQQLLSRLEAVGLEAPRGRALDFGCGAGRLTQALGRHFRECVGIDIAPSMIELAKKFNKHGARCRYYVNELSTLFLFPDNSFDFIYSNIVLQHIHPKYSSQYLQDFVRVLSPGGVLVFQLPATPRVRERSPEDGAPLADEAFQSKVQASAASLKVRPGSSLHLPVTVQNQSSRWWLQAESRQYSISV